MEFVVNSNTIILAATILSSLGVIGGVISKCIKFVEHNKVQDEKIHHLEQKIESLKNLLLEEIKGIKSEQTVLCFGIMSCLKGLKEQGCDGPVTTALERIEEHLNDAAHDE